MITDKPFRSFSRTGADQLKHSALTEKIIGIFYDVYNELGYGFLECVYKETMRLALTDAGMSVSVEQPIPVYFKGRKVGDFRADMLVDGTVLLELKAVRVLDKAHEAQLLHYLKATSIEVGLLLNFGERPQFRRLLFDNERKKIRENPCGSVAEVLS
jgi:GxxExxY protein